MASARAALRVAVVVKKAAAPPSAEVRQKSGWFEGTDARFFSSSQRSLPVAIDAGTWRAFFYKFLEDCHVEVDYLQANSYKSIDSYNFAWTMKII